MTTEAMTEAETNEAMREMFDAAEKAERARDDEAKEVFDHAEEIERRAIRLLALDEAANIVSGYIADVDHLSGEMGVSATAVTASARGMLVELMSDIRGLSR